MHSTRVRPVSWGIAILAMLATFLVAIPQAHAAAEVIRKAGADRYETAVEASTYTFTDPAAVDTVYLAVGGQGGTSVADALSAGAVAAKAGSPLLLTGSSDLHPATRAELRRLKPDEVVVTGGRAALPDRILNQIRNDDQIGASVRRLGGANRYETATQIVLDAFPNGADTVYVASGSGSESPDALSGAPAAFRYAGPLLLVGKDSVPPVVLEAIGTLDPSRIVALGGEAAISSAVVNQLRQHADDVERQSGDSRYTTAVDVSANAFAGARTVVLAYGRSAPDALSGGPVASAFQGPLLLISKDTVPDEVASELLRLNPRRVIILGGESVVSQQAMNRVRAILSDNTALPSGATPDVAFATVDNRQDAPTRGYQVINLGTFDGAYETLTNPGEDFKDVSPVMSPDGRRVVFTRFADDRSESNLFLIDVAVGAGSTRKLFDTSNRFGANGCNISDETWSPTSNRIAFLCIGRQDDAGDALPNTLQVADLRGRTTEVSLPGSAQTEVLGMAYSPDGSRLAVSIIDPALLQDDNPDNDRRASRIVNVDTAALQDGPTGPIANVPQTEFGGYKLATDLHWSRDGSTIVATVGRSSFSTRLLVVDVEAGTTAQRLQEREHRVLGVTSNGARALVQTVQTGDEEADHLRLIPTAGGTATVIANADTLEHGNIWTASLNRGRVVYDDLSAGRGSLFGADEGNVWVANLDGTGQTKLFDVDGVINATPSLNPSRTQGWDIDGDA